jgi:hypothetical protein
MSKRTTAPDRMRKITQSLFPDDIEDYEIADDEFDDSE